MLEFETTKNNCCNSQVIAPPFGTLNVNIT